MVTFVMVLKGSVQVQENRALKSGRFSAKFIYTRLTNEICFNQGCVGLQFEGVWHTQKRLHRFLWRAWEEYQVECLCLYLFSTSSGDYESDGEEEAEKDLDNDDGESKEEVGI